MSFKRRLRLVTLMAAFAIMSTTTRAFQQQLQPLSRRASLWTQTNNNDCIRILSSSSSAATAASVIMSDSFGLGCSRITSRISTTKSSYHRQSHPTILSTRLLSQTSSSSTDTLSDDNTVVSLETKIKNKGDEIRSLKEKGISKEELAPHLTELLELKSRVNPSQQSNSSPSTPQPTKKETTTTINNAEEVESDYITPRSTNYSKWYNDIVRICDLAEPSPVRGCMVIKPWGMSLWDQIRTNLDTRIKDHGAENAYFPLLIPQSFLSKEAEHVDGFAKECAVVTHHRLTSDNSERGGLMADPEAKLEDPLIIRPTSETMIWSMFKKWIVSHRDLPLKVNQWANVMRWEMRTRPFLRTSEFLWQEGHTAHATPEGALADSKEMMHQYADMCETLLAMPVIKGAKSPSERFAGAEETFTIEALMQNGWALQSGTSHFLGQSFGKAFDVTYQDTEGQQQVVWGTSWGVSTRLIGALIMTHSDDAGLVLPPRVAPVQVVVVPIPPKKNDEAGKVALDNTLDKLVADLKGAGLKVKVDDRDYVRNGAKYFEWERKGVPLRIELGPRDVAGGVCVFKYRVGSEGKTTVSLDEVATAATKGLDNMQEFLLESAKERLAAGINTMATYDQMKEALEKDEASEYDGPGLYLVPWKCDAANEEKIKEECKATIRCYPIDVNNAGMAEGKKCFYSGEDATHMALFGRAF